MSANILPNNSENYGTPAVEGVSLPVAPYSTAGDLTPGTLASYSSSSSSSQVVLAASAYRRGAVFYNDSTAVCYLAYATTSSSSAYTVQIATQSSHSLPLPNPYTGTVSAIWASTNGNLRVTSW